MKCPITSTTCVKRKCKWYRPAAKVYLCGFMSLRSIALKLRPLAELIQEIADLPVDMEL